MKIIDNIWKVFTNLLAPLFAYAGQFYAGPVPPIRTHVHMSVIVFRNNDNHAIVLRALNVGSGDFGGGGWGV